jgi:hypothetical protein
MLSAGLASWAYVVPDLDPSVGFSRATQGIAARHGPVSRHSLPWKDYTPVTVPYSVQRMLNEVRRYTYRPYTVCFPLYVSYRIGTVGRHVNKRDVWTWS